MSIVRMKVVDDHLFRTLNEPCRNSLDLNIFSLCIKRSFFREFLISADKNPSINRIVQFGRMIKQIKNSTIEFNNIKKHIIESCDLTEEEMAEQYKADLAETKKSLSYETSINDAVLSVIFVLRLIDNTLGHFWIAQLHGTSKPISHLSKRMFVGAQDFITGIHLSDKDMDKIMSDDLSLNSLDAILNKNKAPDACSALLENRCSLLRELRYGIESLEHISKNNKARYSSLIDVTIQANRK